MNLTKFLLIDGVLLLVGLPMLLIFQGSKKKASLLNDTDLVTQASINFPDQKKLVELDS